MEKNQSAASLKQKQNQTLKRGIQSQQDLQKVKGKGVQVGNRKGSHQDHLQKQNDNDQFGSEEQRAQTSNTYLTSLPRNVNYYGHFFKEHYITEKDIDWVLKLRTQDLELKQKLSRIPNQTFQVFEKKLKGAEQKHTSQDVQSDPNLSQISHLIRHRLGATPSLGQVEFETGLRKEKKIDLKLKEMEKAWTSLPKKDRHEFPELPIKLKDELALKKELKSNGKHSKITQSAFDGFQNFPKYNEKNSKVKNFQQVQHMYTNGSTLSHVQWALSLR